MNTEEIRDAISAEDKVQNFNEFKKSLLDKLYEADNEIILGINDSRFVEKAHIKLRNAIKFVEKKITLEDALTEACEIYAKKELNDAMERNV